MSDRRDVWLVGMIKAGHERAMDELIERYWPLVYNVIGHGLGGSTELDRVLLRAIRQIEQEVPDLPKGSDVRGWVVGTTIGQVRLSQRPGRSLAGGRTVPTSGRDFVAMAIAALRLTGQGRQLAEATRWLSPYDRDVLPLWWLANSGELGRNEVVFALDLPDVEADGRIQRMAARLETAREVVAALAADPLCADLAALAGDALHRAAPYRRDQIARHIRGCRRCAGHRIQLSPPEQLLTGVGLVPPPDLAAYRMSSTRTATAPVVMTTGATSGSAAAIGPGTAATLPAGSGTAALAGSRAATAVGPRGPVVGPGRQATGPGAALAGPGVPATGPGAAATGPGGPAAGSAKAAAGSAKAAAGSAKAAAGSAEAATGSPGRRFRPGNAPLSQRILLGLVVTSIGAAAIVALLPTQRPAPPPRAAQPLPPILTLAPIGPARSATPSAPATPPPTSPVQEEAATTRPARNRPMAPVARPSTAPPPERFHVRYEAEAARLLGGARVEAQLGASGGHVVRWLGTPPGSRGGGHWGEHGPYGRSGAIEFTTTVPTAGRYQMRVFYLSGEDRTGFFRANGGEIQRLPFPSLGRWDTVGSATFVIELTAGTNRLVFGHPSYWIPDLDRITLTG